MKAFLTKYNYFKVNYISVFYLQDNIWKENLFGIYDYYSEDVINFFKNQKEIAFILSMGLQDNFFFPINININEFNFSQNSAGHKFNLNIITNNLIHLIKYFDGYKTNIILNGPG